MQQTNAQATKKTRTGRLTACLSAISLAALLLFSACSNEVPTSQLLQLDASSSQCTVIADGRKLALSPSPYEKNDTLYLPEQALCAALGIALPSDHETGGIPREGDRYYPLDELKGRLALYAKWHSGVHTAFLSQKRPVKLLAVHFLDVGFGDSILLQYPGGENVLIDAGPPEAGAQVVDTLQRQGITELDAVVATHVHPDHVGGMEQVLRSLNVGTLYFDPTHYKTTASQNMLAAANEMGVAVKSAYATSQLPFSLDTLVLYPEEGVEYTNVNNAGMVLKVSNEDVSFLFLADIEAAAEARLLQLSRPLLHADVIKVANHGSASSSTEEFLTAAGPGRAILTGGQQGPFFYPNTQTLERLNALGIQIWNIAEQGATVAVTDGTAIVWARI